MQVKLKQEPKFYKHQLVNISGAVCRVMRDPYTVAGMGWIYEIEHPRIIGPLICLECMLTPYYAKPILRIVK